MAGCGGEAGADGAEVVGSVHGAHASGDPDAELAHPDDALGLVAIGGNPRVMGEPEVAALAGGHPGGRRAALLLQGGAAGGVQQGPCGGRVAEPAGVLFQRFRAGPAQPLRPGGARGLLQRRQRVDGLPRPGHVGACACLGNRDEFAGHVRIAKSTAACAVAAAAGRPGVVAGDPAEGGQRPSRVRAVLPAPVSVHLPPCPAVSDGAPGPGRYRGTISSGPPPVLTVSERRVVGAVGTFTVGAPPSVSPVTEYGPPGTLTLAEPFSVLTITAVGGWSNVS